MATPAKTQPVKPAAQTKAPAAKPAAQIKPVVKAAPPPEPEATEATPELTEEEKAAAAERAAKKAEREAKSAAKKEEKDRFLNQKITLLVEGNPKRANTKAAAWWELYKDGMTVAEVIAAGVSEADVRYNLGHQFLSLN